MHNRLIWKKEYTLVLILNVIYILIFSYIMTAFM